MKKLLEMLLTGRLFVRPWMWAAQLAPPGVPPEAQAIARYILSGYPEEKPEMTEAKAPQAPIRRELAMAGR